MGRSWARGLRPGQGPKGSQRPLPAGPPALPRPQRTLASGRWSGPASAWCSFPGGPGSPFPQAAACVLPETCPRPSEFLGILPPGAVRAPRPEPPPRLLRWGLGLRLQQREGSSLPDAEGPPFPGTLACVLSDLKSIFVLTLRGLPSQTHRDLLFRSLSGLPTLTPVCRLSLTPRNSLVLLVGSFPPLILRNLNPQQFLKFCSVLVQAPAQPLGGSWDCGRHWEGRPGAWRRPEPSFSPQASR